MLLRRLRIGTQDLELGNEQVQIGATTEGKKGVFKTLFGEQQRTRILTERVAMDSLVSR